MEVRKVRLSVTKVFLLKLTPGNGGKKGEKVKIVSH